MAIEQSQTYMLGYGGYGYGYPYGGWYGKRQAGFGPSAAGGAVGNGGTFGNAGGLNGYGGGAQPNTFE
uniref:Glycine-rich cell wall structural protein n=1 Tax=Globodera pallida TaxID=36090 RepID=A0A183C9G2_GLOPA